MSKYKGLFTFDVDNHRYLPVEQADGIIAEMNYRPEPEPKESLIRDRKVRKAVMAWANANKINLKHRCNTIDVVFDHAEHRLKWGNVIIEFDNITGLENLEDGKGYTIAELCGDGEE